MRPKSAKPPKHFARVARASRAGTHRERPSAAATITVKPKGERTWLADTTFFWGLSAVDLLSPAVALFEGRLKTTPAVLSEMQLNVGRNEFLSSAIEMLQSSAVPVTAPDIDELRTVFDLRALWQCSPRETNDLGEAEVIAIAGARNWHAILDDPRASLTMRLRHGALECVDTPYVLLRLVDAGHCSMDKAWEHLTMMERKGKFAHSFRGRRKPEWSSRVDYARVIIF